MKNVSFRLVCFLALSLGSAVALPQTTRPTPNEGTTQPASSVYMPTPNQGNFDVPEFPTLDLERMPARQPGPGAAPKGADPNMAMVDPRQRPTRPAKLRTTEFSRYASEIAGQVIPVFGTEFFTGSPQLPGSVGPVANPAVPADYVVNAGDELLIQITGPYEAEFKQQVRRGGDITLPRLGAVRVAGISAGELSSYLTTRLETQFKKIQVSASFVGLRGMRVYVTGFVEAPGAQVVDSISTITTAMAAAGGPSEGGSYRIAELWRKGAKVGTFDLYDLLLRGDRSKDLSLTADDTIRVAPASSFQVALTGSVNRAAVYELLPNEGLSELLSFAGGLTPVADRKRMAVVQINAEGQREIAQLSQQEPAAVKLTDGAVLHVFSSATLNPGVNATLKIVHVEGEVKRPGSYVLPAISTIADAIAAAGGATQDAFVKGLTLTRASLAKEQNSRLQRSLDEMERSVFESQANISAHSGETGAATLASSTALKNYLDRLRLFKPTGRLIIGRGGDGTALVDPVLETGDRIYMPPRPNAVSVFGAVYGEGSYFASANAPLSTYLKAAGGIRPGADESAIFVLKLDGSVEAAPTGFFSRASRAEIEPGDSIFVPTDTQKGRFWAIAKDIGTLFYQFGLGAAALRVLN